MNESEQVAHLQELYKNLQTGINPKETSDMILQMQSSNIINFIHLNCSIIFQPDLLHYLYQHACLSLRRCFTPTSESSIFVIRKFWFSNTNNSFRENVKQALINCMLVSDSSISTIACDSFVSLLAIESSDFSTISSFLNIIQKMSQFSPFATLYVLQGIANSNIFIENGKSSSFPSEIIQSISYVINYIGNKNSPPISDIKIQAIKTLISYISVYTSMINENHLITIIENIRSILPFITIENINYYKLIHKLIWKMFKFLYRQEIFKSNLDSFISLCLGGFQCTDIQFILPTVNLWRKIATFEYHLEKQRHLNIQFQKSKDLLIKDSNLKEAIRKSFQEDVYNYAKEPPQNLHICEKYYQFFSQKLIDMIVVPISMPFDKPERAYDNIDFPHQFAVITLIHLFQIIPDQVFRSISSRWEILPQSTFSWNILNSYALSLSVLHKKLKYPFQKNKIVDETIVVEFINKFNIFLLNFMKVSPFNTLLIDTCFYVIGKIEKGYANHPKFINSFCRTGTSNLLQTIYEIVFSQSQNLSLRLMNSMNKCIRIIFYLIKDADYGAEVTNNHLVPLFDLILSIFEKSESILLSGFSGTDEENNIFLLYQTVLQVFITFLQNSIPGSSIPKKIIGYIQSKVRLLDSLYNQPDSSKYSELQEDLIVFITYCYKHVFNGKDISKQLHDSDTDSHIISILFRGCQNLNVGIHEKTLECLYLILQEETQYLSKIKGPDPLFDQSSFCTQLYNYIPVALQSGSPSLVSMMIRTAGQFMNINSEFKSQKPQIFNLIMQCIVNPNFTYEVCPDLIYGLSCLIESTEIHDLPQSIEIQVFDTIEKKFLNDLSTGQQDAYIAHDILCNIIILYTQLIRVGDPNIFSNRMLIKKLFRPLIIQKYYGLPSTQFLESLNAYIYELMDKIGTYKVNIQLHNPHILILLLLSSTSSSSENRMEAKEIIMKILNS